MTHPVQKPVGGLGNWMGIVLLFLAFGLIVAVLIAVSPHGNYFEEKRAKAREDKLKTMREDADKALYHYAIVDKGKGTAKIPIDRAMQLTLAELSQKQPTAAGPIEAAPAPAASPAASGAPAGASPAPAGSPSTATQTGAATPAPATTPLPQATGTPKTSSIGGVTSEPAGAVQPRGAAPGSQPGPASTPSAQLPPPSGVAPVSPTARPVQSPPGTPLPVAGQTPTPP